MQYLTYEEYVSIGGALELSAFNRRITRVCGIVTNATYGRIEALYGIPKEVKELCRDLIEFIDKTESGEAVQSRSQSAGGVSESVSYIAMTKQEQAKQINNVIYDYLYNVKAKDGTSILYRGCSS